MDLIGPGWWGAGWDWGIPQGHGTCGPEDSPQEAWKHGTCSPEFKTKEVVSIVLLVKNREVLDSGSRGLWHLGDRVLGFEGKRINPNICGI